MKQEKNINAIRIIATLLIVINSIWLLGGAEISSLFLIPVFLFCGDIGICAFFIFAGYDMYGSFFGENSKHKNGLAWNTVLEVVPVVLTVISAVYRYFKFSQWGLLDITWQFECIIIVLSIAAGFYLGYMELEEGKTLSNRTTILLVIAGIVVLYLTCIRGYRFSSFDTYGILSRVLRVLFVFLITMIFFFFNKILIRGNAFVKVLLWLSDNAYAIFLFHWMIIRVLLYRIEALQSIFQSGIIRFVGLIVVSIVCGVVIHSIYRLIAMVLPKNKE